MQLRVGVQNPDGSPAMPTKPSRARRWREQGKAVGRWNDAGLFYVQLVAEPSGRATQPIVLGLDPGKLYSGIAVQSAKCTLYLAHLVLPFQRVKSRLRARASQRRSRRGRRINRKIPFHLRAHRQERFSNRKQSKLPPSIRACRLMEIRVVSELAKVFPISAIVYEVVKADVDLTSGRKGARSGMGFSPVMMGQYWCMEQLSLIAPVAELCGWQKDGNGTSQIRKHLGLAKCRDKKAQTPASHAVDGIALAASQFVQYRVLHRAGEDSGQWVGQVDVTPAMFRVITRPKYLRRALHFSNAQKGDFRRRKGGTVTPFGLRAGDKVLVRTRGRELIGWVGGFSDTAQLQAVSVHDHNWKKLGRFRLNQVQLIRRSNKLCVI